MTERIRKNSAGTGFVHFTNEVLVQMDEALEVLLEDSRAKCALVLDRTGVILASAGDFHPVSVDNMGAVAAGVIAALNTMVARAVSPEVSVKFYGSDVDKIHFVLLGDRLVLCMLHSRHTTTGQIRSAAKAFASQILPAIENDRHSDQSHENLAKSVQYIEGKLNDLFKDFT